MNDFGGLGQEPSLLPVITPEPILPPPSPEVEEKMKEIIEKEEEKEQMQQIFNWSKLGSILGMISLIITLVWRRE